MQRTTACLIGVLAVLFGVAVLAYQGFGDGVVPDVEAEPLPRFGVESRSGLVAAVPVIAGIEAMPVVRSDAVPVRDADTKGIEPARVPEPASPSSVVREHFFHWRQLAKKAGHEVPNDLDLPIGLHALFAAEHQEYDKVVRDVEAVRMPILDRIADVKKANQQWETLPGPDSIKDPAQAKANRAAIAAARKETRENQTVIQGGFGATFFIIRVDEAEDPGLPPLYARLAAARRQYIDNVYAALAPHLPR